MENPGYKMALGYLEEVLQSGNISGDGPFTGRCQQWLEEKLNLRAALMTTSCTHALELALSILDLNSEDEVIVPSYTYPSTANAALVAGAKVVLAPVDPLHLTLTTDGLEKSVSEKTKAIMVVHYGGYLADVSQIMAWAIPRGIIVIEDAAQGFLSRREGHYGGTIGHMGCFSFHGTKDVVAGEGGALIFNHSLPTQQFKDMYKKAVQYRLKGTDRTDFLAGTVPKYQWVSKGSSYSPSELNMALLYSQFQEVETILKRKRATFKHYHNFFSGLGSHSIATYSPIMPRENLSGEDLDAPNLQNGHCFYLRMKTSTEADHLRKAMKQEGFHLLPHFVPLHLSLMGQGCRWSEDWFEVETQIHQTLLRLPMASSVTSDDIQALLAALENHLEKNNA